MSPRTIRHSLKLSLSVIFIAGWLGACSGINPAAPVPVGKGSPPLSIPAPISRDNRDRPLNPPNNGPVLCDPRANLYEPSNPNQPIPVNSTVPSPVIVNSGDFIGNYLVIGFGRPDMAGMQVRTLLISADRSQVVYRDFLLASAADGLHVLFFRLPVPQPGDLIQILYFLGERPPAPRPDGIPCNFSPSGDFSPSTTILPFVDYTRNDLAPKVLIGNFVVQTSP